MTRKTLGISSFLIFLRLANSANLSMPNAIDLGSLTAVSPQTPMSVTVTLALPALTEAEALQQALYTPGDPQFHKFLTADQFEARFAPSAADVAKVVAGLAKYGLIAQKTTATTLKVTGTAAAMERAFSVTLHSYAVTAQGGAAGYSFHAPLTSPVMPSEITVPVVAMVGFDNRLAAQPRSKTIPETLLPAPSNLPSASAGNPAGSLTVTDFAKRYDVEPLYKRGLTGSGRTIGIMTLAAFTPSDAFTYWHAVGLTIDPNRLQIVNVDGGPGAPSDASGSVETTLDVEQSGGIAPAAKIIVYQAPNTNQGFVDIFAAAIEANVAETLSTSWGAWEWLQNLENSPVTDPLSGETAGVLRAIHELLLRAAIQGQTTFAASGDSGAYDVNGDLGCFGPYSPSVANSCSLTLSTDYPASDPLITAAGGTTLPGVQSYCLNKKCTQLFEVDIKHERVWSWKYLTDLCKAQGLDRISCGIFPSGSGGGVSVYFPVPIYQSGLPGVQLSQPGQEFYLQGYPYSFALPAYYPGRNVPDVSFNGDPDTGYVIYYTSDKKGFEKLTYYGGTSFVAPQLNGVSALLSEYFKSRIGLLNVPLYALALTGQAYGGSNPPLNAIKHGNNWFYKGRDGYNPAAGLGTLDVSNFADTLHQLF